ncbi:MAG TPA: anhydro-N-acetylmuramic acid kinase [Anaerolineaceae bacterium]
MYVIGLMSGTSADGVDAALCWIEGAPPKLDVRVEKHLHLPFPKALREEIFACFNPESGKVDRLCRLNFRLGWYYAEVVQETIRAAGKKPEEIAVVGSHGQTLWHIPFGEDASTLQMGEAAVIAEKTGIPVVSNFRTRDMAAGGQGAPLVARVDVLLLTDPIKVRAAQNIGGIANVTYLPPLQGAGLGQAFAFDTGPGNMLIDDAMLRLTGGREQFDRDGMTAEKGEVSERLLAELMAEAYYQMAPPKTTGRELFGVQYGEKVWARGMTLGLSGEDIVATLTDLTAWSIAEAYRRFLPVFPEEVIVSGGGARNPYLMRRLMERCAPAKVLASDQVGIGVEEKEAVAFAVLAYETYHHRAGNLPAATGAKAEVILGSLTPGKIGRDPASRQSQIGSRADVVPGMLTESRNPASMDIDRLTTLEMVKVMNSEDQKVPQALERVLPEIAEAIDRVAERMQQGGRLIYIGAGTSGRLGILDASECPPTFSADPSQVVGIIAGGAQAIQHAVEGAEDSEQMGVEDIRRLNVGRLDSVVGLAASGRTPYVIGGLREARVRGALTLSITCNSPSPVEEAADIRISPLVGPEILTGSTRLKAGTAQKLALNMLSTGVMIRLGKTYGNLMVDVQATNQKLRQRARRIVAQACGIDEQEAGDILQQCNGEVKTAIVMHLGAVSVEEARHRLSRAKGVVRQALLEGRNDS